MKYQGRTLSERWYKEVTLQRPDGNIWTLRVRPLSLGFPQWLYERGIMPPAVPMKVTRKENGRIQRDPTGKVQLECDDSQQNYQYALTRYQLRVAFLGIWQSLRDEMTLVFETKPPSDLNGWAEFADELGNELEQAGFTLSDVLQLCEEVHRFQDQSTEYLQETRQRFFSTSREETS